MSYVYEAGSEFTEFTTTTGEKLKVYTPPLALIAGILPDRPEPELPTVTMQTKGGTQKRLAKKGDPEFGVWEKAHDAWEQERFDLTEAAKLVTALRDVKYPKPITLESFPVHVQDLIEVGLVKLPEHAYLLKAMYLEATVLAAQNDKYEVNFIIQLRSGVDPEVVAQIKKNFRDNSLRIFTRSVAEENGSSGPEQSDDSETVVEDGERGA